MSKYGVSIPVTGYIYVEVDADSEEEAENLALNMDLTIDSIESWSPCRSVVQGNVCSAELREIEAELLE